jgi:hypothetical protein
MLLLIFKRNFKNVTLIIAGKGDAQYVNSLKRKVADNNLEQQIKFTGL